MAQSSSKIPSGEYTALRVSLASPHGRMKAGENTYLYNGRKGLLIDNLENGWYRILFDGFLPAVRVPRQWVKFVNSEGLL